MNQKANDTNAVPCLVLAFTPEEFEFVKRVLQEDGYDDDLKAWVLDNMQTDENGSEKPYVGAADRTIHNISAFIKENPDTIRAAGTVAGNLLRRTLKRGH